MKVGHDIWDTQYLSKDIRSRAACLPEANPTGCSAIVMDLQIGSVHIKPRKGVSQFHANYIRIFYKKGKEFEGKTFHVYYLNEYGCCLIRPVNQCCKDQDLFIELSSNNAKKIDQKFFPHLWLYFRVPIYRSNQFDKKGALQ